MGAFGSNPNSEADQPSTSRSRFHDDSGKPRILVVEDSRIDSLLIQEAIDRCGIEAIFDILRDGHAAKKYFEAADAQSVPCPDLILLDLNLPKISGDEVLKHLRSSQRCRNTKVLVVSSSDAPSDRAMAERHAAVAYFKKPSIYAEFMKLGPLVQKLLASGSNPAAE